MPHEQENRVVLIGNRETIRYLKGRKMDIQDIWKDLKDVPGTKPAIGVDMNLERYGSWDFYVEKESSRGMEVTFSTKYATGCIRLLTFLLHKFPDLYARVEYRRHGRDVCFSGIWHGSTTHDKRVKIEELFWRDEEVGGCPWAPDAEDPFWQTDGDVDGAKKSEVGNDSIFIRGRGGYVGGTEITKNTTEEEVLEKAAEYYSIQGRNDEYLQHIYECVEKDQKSLFEFRKQQAKWAAEKQQQEEEEKKRRQENPKRIVYVGSSIDAEDIEPIPIPKKIVKVTVVDKATQTGAPPGEEVMVGSEVRVIERDLSKKPVMVDASTGVDEPKKQIKKVKVVNKKNN